MISKNFYFVLILRMLLLIGFTVATTFAFIKGNILIGVLLIILIAFQCFKLIRFLNHTNKDIAYHLKAMINEDFTLSFQKNRKNKSAQQLYATLATLNEKIQKIHLDNQVQEQYYKELIKQADIGVITLNEEGHILFSNKKAEDLLNYSPINHVEQVKRIQWELYEVLKELKFKEKLIELNDEKQVKQITLKRSSIIINNENIHLITLQDIRSTLNKNEADSWIKLIRVLTHEIMNSIAPLTSISSSLLHQYNSNGETSFSKEQQNTFAKGLTIIKDQTNHLETFVSSYRELLNVAPPNKKIIFGESLLENVCMLSHQFLEDKDIELSVDSEEDMGTLYADEQQITQVLLNLIKNASEAFSNQENRTITISIETKEFEIKNIEVSNNGDEIPEEIKSQIFIPFYTSKPQGSGVGLSLSRHIMLLHKGNLTLKSNPQQTSFSLEF